MWIFCTIQLYFELYSLSTSLKLGLDALPCTFTSSLIVLVVLASSCWEAVYWCIVCHELRNMWCVPDAIPHLDLKWLHHSTDNKRTKFYSGLVYVLQREASSRQWLTSFTFVYESRFPAVNFAVCSGFAFNFVVSCFLLCFCLMLSYCMVFSCENLGVLWESYFPADRWFIPCIYR